MSATPVSAHPTPVRVSVVIPPKNEAEYLRATLSDLKEQTIRPFEIIVADAASSDGTQAIAGELGCKVIAGGLPAEGRNRGAAASSGEWLLFVDADVRMGPETIDRALEAATRDHLDAASTWFVPDRGGWFLRITHRLSNDRKRCGSEPPGRRDAKLSRQGAPPVGGMPN